MDLFMLQHRWRWSPTGDRDTDGGTCGEVLGVYTTHEAAWNAMRTAGLAAKVEMEATAVPDADLQQIHVSRPRHSVKTEDHVLSIRPATLHPAADQDTMPACIYYLEEWKPLRSAYVDEPLTVYRDPQSILVAAKAAANHQASAHPGTYLTNHNPLHWRVATHPGVGITGTVWSVHPRVATVDHPPRQLHPGLQLGE